MREFLIVGIFSASWPRASRANSRSRDRSDQEVWKLLDLDNLPEMCCKLFYLRKSPSSVLVPGTDVKLREQNSTQIVVLARTHARCDM